MTFLLYVSPLTLTHRLSNHASCNYGIKAGTVVQRPAKSELLELNVKKRGDGGTQLGSALQVLGLLGSTLESYESSRAI